MQRQPKDPAVADGPDKGSVSVDSLEPSTRRVSSGSPDPAPSRASGEPIFSTTAADREAEVFADLKARISRLWDVDADAEAIRATLIENGRDEVG